MEHETKLRILIEKYRKNRENVPLQILKTKYKEPYAQLIENIGSEVADLILQHLQIPKSAQSAQVSLEGAKELCNAFDEIYVAYRQKLSQAVTKHRDADEVIRLAKEIAAAYQVQLDEILARTGTWGVQDPTLRDIES